jgi:hypothetical protein
MDNRKQPDARVPGRELEKQFCQRFTLPVGFVVLLMGISCTDTNLYNWQTDPFRPDKLTVSGTVCSDDPRQRDFPVKILFLVDTTLVMAEPENDPGGDRGRAVDSLITTLAQDANYSFGVISFGGKARNLVDGGFTRDTSVLGAAAQQLRSVTPCQTELCRDLRGAMDMASAIITGDILASDAGEVSRSSYVVILFAGGSQVPPLGRCACRNRESELTNDNWGSCPVVNVPNPAGGNPLKFRGWAECDSDPSQNLVISCPASNLATVAPNLSGRTCPDSYSHWIPPGNVKPYGFENMPAGCTKCEICCVHPAGGRSDSCEERQLVSLVRDLKSFAAEQGVAQFQFHTSYLPDLAVQRHQPTSLFRPLECGAASVEADRKRAERVLIQMAFAGGGTYKSFYDETTKTKETILFDHVNLFESRNPLLHKELLVTNASAISTGDGLLADSDQDGIPDLYEQQLGTCDRDLDTDGDGVSDAVEIRLARDPNDAEEPLECIDLLSTNIQTEDLCPATEPPAGSPAPTKERRVYRDQDGDLLNECEERLLGTNDSLFDSDADGIPDKVEFVAGTNYLAVDHLKDLDFDGIFNRDEVRGHTDPRANDAQEQLDLAYRYQLTDEGIAPVVSVSQSTRITGINIKSASAQSKGGVGWLKFDPGPPGLPFHGVTRQKAKPATLALLSISVRALLTASSSSHRSRRRSSASPPKAQPNIRLKSSSIRSLSRLQTATASVLGYAT